MKVVLRPVSGPAWLALLWLIAPGKPSQNGHVESFN